MLEPTPGPLTTGGRRMTAFIPVRREISRRARSAASLLRPYASCGAGDVEQPAGQGVGAHHAGEQVTQQESDGPRYQRCRRHRPVPSRRRCHATVSASPWSKDTGGDQLSRVRIFSVETTREFSNRSTSSGRPSNRPPSRKRRGGTGTTRMARPIRAANFTTSSCVVITSASATRNTSLVARGCSRHAISAPVKLRT